MAARVFTDLLGGPGAWAKRAPDQKQILFDNLGTVLGDTGDRPVTTCAQIQKFDFPILLLTGERSPKRYGEMFGAMKKVQEHRGADPNPERSARDELRQSASI